MGGRSRVRSVALVGLLIGGCRFGFDASTRADAAGDDDDDGDDGDASSNRDAGLDGSQAGDAAPDAASLTCPTGYLPLAGETSKYKAISSTDGWLAAEQACETDGTHLVVLDTASELAMMVALLPAQNLWLGVTDRKVVGQWLKVTGGVATYLPWDSSEPDAANLECVQLDGVTTKLGDQGCSSGRRYVCECDGAAAMPSTY